MRQRQRKHLQILKDRSKMPVEGLQFVFVDIFAADCNLALRDRIKPHDKLYESGFSCAVMPDNCYLLSLSDGHVHIVQGRSIRTIVCEAHILDFNVVQSR